MTIDIQKYRHLLEFYNIFMIMSSPLFLSMSFNSDFQEKKFRKIFVSNFFLFFIFELRNYWNRIINIFFSKSFLVSNNNNSHHYNKGFFIWRFRIFIHWTSDDDVVGRIGCVRCVFQTIDVIQMLFDVRINECMKKKIFFSTQKKLFWLEGRLTPTKTIDKIIRIISF